MRVSSILVGLIVFVCACDTENNFAIPDENYFVKFYGEEGDQEGVDFIVNTDGSVVMVGNTSRPGVLQQIYIVKVDANGQVLWQRRIGLPDKKDIAKDVELHADGRIVIAGETEMGANNRDVYIKTLAQDGSPLDSARAGLKLTNGSDADEVVKSISMVEPADGYPAGFIVSGSTTSPNDNLDGLHIRFTDSPILRFGDPWKEITGNGNTEDVIVKIFQISGYSPIGAADRYYSFGYTNANGGNNSNDFKYWIVPLGKDGEPSNNGTELLDEIGSQIEDEILTSVIESPLQSGSGFILSGIARLPTGESRSFVVKLTRPLSINFPKLDILSQTYPTNLGNDVSGLLTVQSSTKEQFFLLSNDNQFQDQGSNLALTLLNRDLTKQWPVPLIFGGVGDDFAGSVAELPNGRILIVGTMTVGGLNGQKKMVLMKLNPEGKLTE